MAKAKQKKPARTRAAPSTDGPDPILVLPVAYSNVNFGDKTVSLSASVSRGNLTVAEADRQLCGKRLSGKILVRAGGAQAEQGSLPGADADLELAGVFDVKGFSASPKHIRFGLAFAVESVDIETMAHFAKREGVVSVYSTGPIPAEEKGGDDDHEADE